MPGRGTHHHSQLSWRGVNMTRSPLASASHPLPPHPRVPAAPPGPGLRLLRRLRPGAPRGLHLQPPAGGRVHLRLPPSPRHREWGWQPLLPCQSCQGTEGRLLWVDLVMLRGRGSSQSGKNVPKVLRETCGPCSETSGERPWELCCCSPKVLRPAWGKKIQCDEIQVLLMITVTELVR